MQCPRMSPGGAPNWAVPRSYAPARAENSKTQRIHLDTSVNNSIYEKIFFKNLEYIMNISYNQ